MIRYNFKQNKAAHITAMTVAISLHLGLFFWLTKPSKPFPLEQAITVTMVAPSSEKEVKKIATINLKQNFIKSHSQEKTNEVAKVEKVKKLEKAEVAKKDSREFKTSGQVDKNATEKTAARSEPVFNAAYLQNPAPYYPSAAKKRGAQGKVMLRVRVTKSGTAASVEVAQSSGHTSLDESAVKAVEDWRFVPAYVGLEAVEATVLVPIEFKLN